MLLDIHIVTEPIGRTRTENLPVLGDGGGEGVQVGVYSGKNNGRGNEEEDGFLPTPPIAQIQKNLVVFGGDGGTLRGTGGAFEGGTGGGRGGGRRRSRHFG